MQLTAREREIAMLVTEGKTNKDIGTRLGISRRTVENHVASIFNRLSIRARWQLTTELIDRF
jgi:DNA-binding NarL/FixJ family response regulator